MRKYGKYISTKSNCDNLDYYLFLFLEPQSGKRIVPRKLFLKWTVSLKLNKISCLRWLSNSLVKQCVLTRTFFFAFRTIMEDRWKGKTDQQKTK